MGNSQTSIVQSKTSSENPFYSSNSDKDSQLSQLLSEFRFISIYEDELFKRCSIIEHKDTKELIVTKEIGCESEVEMKKLFAQFQRRKTVFTHHNLLRLRYVLKKVNTGIFSDQFKLILFFDYIIADLYSEYANRFKKHQQFTADQINIILCGIIRGYAALEAENVSNNKVRLRNLYFGLENGIPLPKVIDSKLFPTPSNIESIKNKQNYQDVFLSPEELKNYNNNKYANAKSGVYSLGISIMQICLLNPCQDLYNYEKVTINYSEVENRLNIIKNKYSLSVFYILREMLERNDDSRPSFTKLAENLPSNIKNLPQTMTISMMKSNNKEQNSSSKVTSPRGYTKLINPIAVSKVDRKMHSTTLASQYRPNVDASQIYTNGNMYTGQKKQNLRHGKGKYVYADGSYYFGDWFKGKMEGFGQLYDVNANLEYQGSWKDDHYEGKGKLYSFSSDWVKYEGQLRAGKMEGFGEMFFKDGNRYKGEFRADYPWGKGRLFNRNGQCKAGIWEKGNFISEY